jgi:hypothetical protein
MDRKRKAAWMAAWLGGAMAACLLAMAGGGCGEPAPPPPPKSAEPEPPTVKVPTHEELDAAEEASFKESLAKGGRNWSSMDSFRPQDAEQDVATQRYLLIRPREDVPVRLPSLRHGGTPDYNYRAYLECYSFPDKFISRTDGKIKVSLPAEMHYEGRVLSRVTEATLRPDMRTQHVTAAWWAESPGDLTGVGTLYVYIGDANDPKKAYSNILKLNVELERPAK